MFANKLHESTEAEKRLLPPLFKQPSFRLQEDSMAEGANVSEAEYFEQLMQFYNETIAFESKIGIIIPCIFVIIIVVGLVGNIMVVVVALNRQMRNSTNTLIIGLAVSDLMFLLICVPFTAIDYAVPVWLFPEWTCSVVNFFQHTSAYCSVWTLSLMAVDRYLAVVHPVSSMTLRTPKNTLITLTVVYLIIMASQIPVGMMHGIYTYDFIVETRSTCAIISIATNNATETEARTYFITFNVFGYILPLGLSSFLYWKMLRRLWDTPRPGSGAHMNGSIRARPDARRAKRKATRLVSCVMIIWALCWLPLNVCFFMSGIAYPETLVMKYGVKMVIVQIASQVLAYTNSCLNPILYALMSENFRKGFIRVISTLINKLSCGTVCLDNNKIMRIELTTANHSAAQTSIRRLQCTSSTLFKQTSGEKTTLIQNRDGASRYVEMTEISHNGTTVARRSSSFC